MPRHTQNKSNFVNAKAKSALNPKLVVFLKQPEHHATIQQFWQGIENRNAKMAERNPKAISIKTAKRGFLRALHASPNKSPYAKDAEALLRKLLKTSTIVAHYQKQVDQVDHSSELGPRIKIQLAVGHFKMQAQKLRKEIQNCPPGPQLSLLKKQASLYSSLALTLTGTADRMDAEDIFEQLSANPAFTLPPQHPVVVANKDYEKLIRQAAKFGLGDDPYVQNWLVSHENPRDSQNRDIKPIQENELPIYTTIDTLREQGSSWRQIHRELMKQSLVPKQSWQAFHTWITHRDMQALYGLDD